MPATNGEITFERTVKTGDFENKKMKGTVSFTTPEGGDFKKEWNTVADWVVKEVETRLGLSAKLELPAGTRNDATPKGPIAGPNLTATEVLAREGRTKADLEAEAIARATMPPAPTGRRKKADAVPLPVQSGPVNMDMDMGDGGDGTGIPGFLKREKQADASLSTPMVTATTEEWEAAAAPPKEVTDKDLTDACTRKTKTGVGAPVIKELIAQFVKLPGTLREIPQAKRSEFLTKLEALK